MTDQKRIEELERKVNILVEITTKLNIYCCELRKKIEEKNPKLSELKLDDFIGTMGNSELMSIVDGLATEFTRNIYSLNDISELHEPSEDDPDCDVLKEDYQGDYNYFYDTLFDFCTNKLLKIKNE